MSNVVNLNRFRKAKARAEKRAQADENAVRHGRSKAEKQLEQSRNAQAERSHEAHHLEPGDASGAPEGDEPPRS